MNSMLDRYGYESGGITKLMSAEKRSMRNVMMRFLENFSRGYKEEKMLCQSFEKPRKRKRT